MRIRFRFDGDIAVRLRHADLLPAETRPCGLALFAAIVTAFAFDVVVARQSVDGRVRRAANGDFKHGREFAAVGPALRGADGFRGDAVRAAGRGAHDGEVRRRQTHALALCADIGAGTRSEAPRVGKEGVVTWNTRGSPWHE